MDDGNQDANTPPLTGFGSGANITSDIGSVVDIYDGDMLIGNANVVDGKWEFPIADLEQRSYAVTAKYGVEEAGPRTFHASPLKIDLSTMILNGIAVIANLRRSGNDAPNNSAVRAPTGGKPPYSFTSNSPLIASVTAGGKVTGLSNGTATIAVVDSVGNEVSYPVAVSNVYRLLESKGPHTHASAIAWIRSQNIEFIPTGRLMLRFYNVINRMYLDPWATGTGHWYGYPLNQDFLCGYVHAEGGGMGGTDLGDFPTVTGALCLIAT